MLKKEDFAVIKALAKRGVYQKDIAQELGIHPRTVSRALKRDGAPSRKRKGRGSKLDRYKGTVDRLLSEGVWNAVVILREIEADGYEGGITVVREYIAPKRVLRAGRATVRFETEPGEQLQSDWGEIVVEVGGIRQKVYFIVNQLGYSRRFHAWCAGRMDAEHTYEGLIRSLEYFGGVPREVVVDNQKAAVVHHPKEGRVQFNARFVDLANHYGFTPRACRPYRARTKGKDERMVGYLKHHFFVRYARFSSWVHLNQQLETWLKTEADPRIHGTVNEKVTARFEREVPHLHPLPPVRYDTAYYEQRQVGWDSYIDVRGNRYSVPATFAGQRVAVRIGLDETVRVLVDDQVVATHRLQQSSEGWVTVAEHHATLWATTLQVEQRSLAAYEEATQWT